MNIYSLIAFWRKKITSITFDILIQLFIISITFDILIQLFIISLFSILFSDALFHLGIFPKGLTTAEKPPSLPISILLPYLFNPSPSISNLFMHVIRLLYSSISQLAFLSYHHQLLTYTFFSSHSLFLSAWPNHQNIFLFTYSLHHTTQFAGVPRSHISCILSLVSSSYLVTLHAPLR